MNKARRMQLTVSVISDHRLVQGLAGYRYRRQGLVTHPEEVARASTSTRLPGRRSWFGRLGHWVRPGQCPLVQFVRGRVV